jgi:UDP-glucuronate decarboxylase
MNNKIINEDLGLICGSDLDWEKLKNSTMLITGAAGMLASYMVFTLLKLNELHPELKIKVVALGRDRSKLKRRFSEYADDRSLSIISADVAAKLELNGKLDYIIHAASAASSQYYGIDPIGVIAPNVFGTMNLLGLAREKEAKGLLYFSSGEVSGVVDKPLVTEADYGNLDPTQVRSCYGESKRMGENLCACWHHQYKVPTFVVRPDHTYGPTMDLDNDRRVFAEFTADVVNNRDITVKSDGTPVRTFCYLSDATEGFFRVLLKGAPGESYNVSNNQGQISISDLAKILISLFPDKKLKVVYQARAKDDSYLENRNKVRPMLATAKIEKLGYKCRFDLRNGFLRTIQSFLAEGETHVERK